MNRKGRREGDNLPEKERDRAGKGGPLPSDLALVELLIRHPGLTEEEARRELNFPKDGKRGSGLPLTPVSF